MIHWCCYCQTLLGEVPPLTSFEITHGICPRCEARLEANEAILEEHETAIAFSRALFTAARDGDLATCSDLVARAREAGFGAPEILVGLVQPALVEIGARWERGLVTVADEHRFTRWCERVVTLVERPPAREPPLDLLILQAPGNRHELGARVAEQVLVAAGVRAEAIVPELPPDDLVALVHARAPLHVGFSCALPDMVDAASEVATRLVRGGYRGGVFLSGQALRRAPGAFRPPHATICLTVEEARRRILGEHA